MVLAICTSSNVDLYFYDVPWGYLERFLCYRAAEWKALCSVLGIAKVPRDITKNIYIQELWFLRSTHRLMLVNISMTFHDHILNGLQVTGLQGRHCILFSASFTNDFTPTGPWRSMRIYVTWGYLEWFSSYRATERTAFYSFPGIASSKGHN